MPVDCESEYLRNLDDRATDTCKWAFDESDDAGKLVLRWLGWTDKEHALVRLTGVAGQGKSVIAASIIERCRTEHRKYLYFFCRHDDPKKRSASAILRTIAFQLAEIAGIVRKNISQK